MKKIDRQTLFPFEKVQATFSKEFHDRQEQEFSQLEEEMSVSFD